MLLKQYDTFYKKLIEHSRRFIDEHAKSTGDFNKVLEGGKDPRYINDYRYYAFTKSTKSLIGIYRLLEMGNYEDAIILSRTMLECYISCRYLDDKYDADVLKDMVIIPTALSDGLFIYKDGKVIRKDTNDTLEYNIKNPGILCIGKDKSYFYDLYEYLCEIAHCNISQFDSFLDDDKKCVLYTEKNSQVAHFIGLFTFSKLFESVVLLESTRFEDKNEEQECEDLLQELTEFMYDEMADFCETCNTEDSLIARTTRQMVRSMMNSLYEQLGRVDKSFVDKFKKRHTETPIEHILKPVLLENSRPSEFFNDLRAKNKINPRYDEMNKLVGFIPDGISIEGADAWEHTMILLDRAAQVRDKSDKPFAFMLSVLISDFDMSDEKKPGPCRQDAEKLLARITNNDKIIRIVFDMRNNRKERQ